MPRPLLALAAALLVAPPAALAQNEPDLPGREAVPGCLARATRTPLGFAGEVQVKVGLDAAGNPTRMDMTKGQAPEALVDAIADAVQLCRWLSPTDSSGKPVAGSATVTLQIEDRARELTKADPGPKLPVPRTPADEANAGCVTRALKLPTLVRTAPVVAHFTVTPEGKAQDVSLTGDEITPELREAFLDAIPYCAYKPGRDEQGNPVASRFSMLFAFSQRSFFGEEEPRDPRLVKDPRPESQRCVQWAIDRDPFDPRHREILVRFQVSVEGVAEKFSIKPDGVDARSRTLIMDAFHACRWIPGQDKDGKPMPGWLTWPLTFRNSVGGTPGATPQTR